jgi:hypothetical protein
LGWLGLQLPKVDMRVRNSNQLVLFANIFNNRGENTMPQETPLGALPGEIEEMDRPFFKGIENEFSHINTEVNGLKAMTEISVSEINFSKIEKWVVDAARARSIEKIYSGIERILIRIGIEIDGILPSEGGVGNRDLLDRMSVEMQVTDFIAIRPPVISEKTLKILHELMRFRRLERGTYGFMIGSLNLDENAEKAMAIVPVFKAEVDRFKANLAKREYSNK